MPDVRYFLGVIDVSDPFSMTMDKSILRRKMLLFSVYIGTAKQVFSLVENTRVRLKLSS